MNPTLDIYVIESNQGQCIVTGDINNAYTEECRTRVLYMYLSTNVHSMFSSLAALMDLNSTPNLADVPPDYIGFSYRTIEQINDCTKQAAQDPVCVTRSYSPGSALWLGVVSSVVVLNDGPTTPDACKDGGWKAFGFKNQGQCVNYVNHQ